MPWQHCDLDVHDDVACPTCGITKVEWTIKVGSTRVFKLSANTCKVVLFEADGSYAEGTTCRMELPDGTIAEPTLDDGGYAKGTTRLPGDVLVSFPGRRVEPASKKTAARAAPGVAAGEAFLCPVGNAKHEFRVVAGHWVEVEFLDDRGLLLDEQFEARLPDGTIRSGALVKGVARLEDVPAGEVEFRFPSRDGSNWYAHDRHSIDLELRDDAGAPVPNEPFVVRLPDGTTRPGVLDGDGRARLEDLPSREVEVAFPKRSGTHWDFLDHFPDAVARAAPPAPTRSFVLALRHAGVPVPGARWVARTTDGHSFGGVLDEHGERLIEGLDVDTCEVSFPEVADWRLADGTTPLHLELRLADGRPAAFARFLLRTLDGVERGGGVLDEHGRATVQALAGEAYEVTFPEHESWARRSAPPVSC